MMSVPHKVSRGFTLIEVLIALVISSLLLSLLSGVFYSVTSRWEKNAVTAKDDFDQAKRLYLLQRSIAGMIPWYERDTTFRKEPKLFFIGDKSRVQWVTSSPVFFQGEARSKLEVVRTGDNYLLRYSESPLYKSPLYKSNGSEKDNRSEFAARFDVLASAENFVFKYLGVVDLQTKIAGGTSFGSRDGASGDAELGQKSRPHRSRNNRIGGRSMSLQTSGTQWFSQYNGEETRLLPEKIVVSIQGKDKEYHFTVIDNSLKHVGIFDEST